MRLFRTWLRPFRTTADRAIDRGLDTAGYDQQRRDRLAVTYRWDPYPFILLNLLFSTQAAYAAPLIPRVPCYVTR